MSPSSLVFNLFSSLVVCLSALPARLSVFTLRLLPLFDLLCRSVPPLPSSFAFLSAVAAPLLLPVGPVPFWFLYFSFGVKSGVLKIAVYVFTPTFAAGIILPAASPFQLLYIHLLTVDYRFPQTDSSAEEKCISNCTSGITITQAPASDGRFYFPLAPPRPPSIVFPSDIPWTEHCTR